VIVVLTAAAGDAPAPLAAAVAPEPVVVLSLEEVAAEPSTLHDPSFHRSTLTVGGERVSVGSIRGVVNLLPAVVPAMLSFYDEAERGYQAAELYAWLSFLLASLACLVVNRPTPLGINGPVLDRLGWYHLALRAGLAVAEVDANDGDVEIACVGNAVVAPTGTAADDLTLRLARVAGVAHLRARYDRSLRFAGASGIPDVGREDVCLALGALFRG
jgi:hypothetical protein